MDEHLPSKQAVAGSNPVIRSMAKRIKYKRGVKLPAGAVYVGRPTRWGNPYKIGDPNPTLGEKYHQPMTREDVIGLYRNMCTGSAAQWQLAIIENLRGKDLACWCPPNEECHADILLEVANAPQLWTPDMPR